jgi:hypothetical protein
MRWGREGEIEEVGLKDFRLVEETLVIRKMKRSTPMWEAVQNNRIQRELPLLKTALLDI